MAFSSQKHDLDFFSDLAAPQPQQQQMLQPPAAGQESSLANGAAATTEETAAAPLLPLLDVCGQKQTWGLFAVDLCTGEAVVQEEGGCRLHLAAGEQHCSVWA